MAELADYILLYDADCGTCTRFRNTIEFLDTHRNLRFMSIDAAERAGLLDILPDDLRHRSFHLVLPSMSLESGAEALPILVGILPSGKLFSKMIKSAPLGRWMLGFLYSVVARRHEAGLCKLSAGLTDISDEHGNLRKKTKARTRPISAKARLWVVGLLTVLFLV